ncbi:fumarylacetoacetate hydrolase family protein [Aspergillus pseudonomiae]|uniref:Fumarylacetoacetate hydrolase family protein n=1 Tax=Aspergillus pseudonomiae TaxID=1506151 RepID=A0A5N7D4B9_9EURO|nr:fumarylacetoacetate hydrolase family protein [Aspergillus pseudonomiae]KAE8400977.1 fumarylacetoacetate hydrolase family protein [Aspergillus pseudonomiae]
MAAFKNLVRFATGEQQYYGELIRTENNQFTVQQFDGNPFDGLVLTDKVHHVSSLLSPVENTPLIICIGLNYKEHAKEANLTVPTYPPVFTKPADALAGPFESIRIHPDAQSHLDYEGELTVVIGKDAKNISAEDALDYVLGYTAGNDLSARNFQLPEASGGQFCYAKSFDKFAPIGHVLVAAQEIKEPQGLNLVTRVNGVPKQTTNTSDMIWGVREIVSHLSRGTTLRKGTVIMTGTPSGVGFFRKEFLKDGDVVEVELGGVAKVENTISYE